jgi:hypothetical protein
MEQTKKHYKIMAGTWIERDYLKKKNFISVYSLSFIGQTGRPCSIKCNALWAKANTLFHTGAGMGI